MTASAKRSCAGLEAARARGRIGGRRPKLTSERWAQAGRLIRAGVQRQLVAIIYNVGLSTLYRKFPAGENETADIPYATCCG
ncbi:TPA: helix-turn-helix domain-containing protein [Salmonella enterica]|nr:helix-turn-helix domain-containing protein [Salmonella enterica]